MTHEKLKRKSYLDIFLLTQLFHQQHEDGSLLRINTDGPKSWYNGNKG